MQDRPDSGELIDAVTRFIEQELLPTISDPRLRFRALIAANVLAVVSRELAQGDAALIAEYERLITLSGRSDDPTAAALPSHDSALREAVAQLSGELCAHIRAGQFDDAQLYGPILAHAQATVIDKVRVTNPRHLERLAAEFKTRE